MKATKSLLTLLVLGSGVLSSCVATYPDGGGSTTSTVTTQYRPGYVSNSLPTRYETEMVGGTRYYRSENTYYRPQGDRYVVVESPRGSRDYTTQYENRRSDGYDRMPGETRRTTVVRTLPSGAQIVTHRGSRYYRAGNDYYQPSGNGYVIVSSPY